jgi:hypothetical protein
MIDTIKPLTKENELVSNSVIITSISEAISHGLNNDDVTLLCEEVSHSIGEYNHTHPAEMLPKPPQIIYDQLSKGLSCVIIARDDTENRWRFLHHGSIYPVFEDGEEKILGTQIVEFGSAITHKKFSGLGLHTKGTEMRLKMMDRFRIKDVEVFGISTVKRVVTGHTWEKFGVNPVSFWEHPYTSFLTNTCQGTSERFGNPICQSRRTSNDSKVEMLNNLFIKTDGNPYLPCTLIATDQNVLKRFEDKCRKLHKSFGGTPLLENDISVDSYKRAAEFFDHIKEYAKN